MRPAPRGIDAQTELPASLRTRKGWSRLFDLKRAPQPHLHQIEPTNQCVYACVMCPRRKMKRDVGRMELSLFRRVIDEVATFSEPTRSQEIELFHFGEALFHPQLEEMVGYAAERGLKTVLSVNAPEFDDDLARRLLARGPHKVIFSLDGPNQSSYSAARGDRADYERARRNIEGAVALRDHLGSDTRLVVRMILMRSHEELAPDFEQSWAERGVEVELRQFFPWNDPSMKELGDYDRYPPGMPCPFPWQHVVVQWNGDVVPCCRDYDATLRLGNVGEQSLVEIWNGAGYETFREQHRTGDYGDNRTCRDCMSLYYTPGRDEQG